MARILLAGCGSIGTQLGQALAQQGHTPVGLRRSNVAMPFTCLHGDLSTPLPASFFPQPIDYVVYTTTPTDYSDSGYQTAYPMGVQHLLESLTEHPIKRFFFVSSTAVYHQDDGSWVDENSPTLPTRYNGIRVLEAENLLQHSCVPSTSIRFGGIYGRGRTRLIKKILQGAEAQSTPPKYTNRIHQDDCVGVLGYLIGYTEAGGQLADCYVAVDDEPADELSVYQWLATHFNAPAPKAIAAGPGASQNKRCSNKRLKETGYAFMFPNYRSGYAE